MGTLKQWAEATHQGDDTVIVALREAVMCMVTLTNAMLLVTTKRPVTQTLVANAIECAKELVLALEALHVRVAK